MSAVHANSKTALASADTPHQYKYSSNYAKENHKVYKEMAQRSIWSNIRRPVQPTGKTGAPTEVHPGRVQVRESQNPQLEDSTDPNGERSQPKPQNMTQ